MKNRTKKTLDKAYKIINDILDVKISKENENEAMKNFSVAFELVKILEPISVQIELLKKQK